MPAINNFTTGEAPKDRWGRYLIKTRSGKETSFPRVTTIAKSLDDEGALTAWKGRMTATGLVQRNDLLVAASAALEDRSALDRIVQQAIEAAGASSKANIGTALHSLTQALDLGQQPAILPGLQTDVNAYTTGITQHGVIIDPRFVEVLLVNEKFEYAGTADRIARFNNRKKKQIMDLKTGSIDYAMNAIAVQMAMYANADYIYDWRTQEHIPMPDIDKTRGVILHLPAGQGTLALYEVDLVAGWEAAQMAMAVRTWRKRKDLHIKVHAEVAANDGIPPTAGVATSAAPDHNRDTALERIKNLPTTWQDLLKRHWPYPGVKLPDFNEAQLDTLLKQLDELERESSAPFLSNREPDLVPISEAAATPVKKKAPAKKKAVKK
jgi:hypothetical protein